MKDQLDKQELNQLQNQKDSDAKNNELQAKYNIKKTCSICVLKRLK